uniref:Uncharacterized protein n=1 Tax=Ochrobactrum phage ORM_20 TaxID=2985243 RepID=A0A9N6ZGB8_9VIRU|nr:hypothetical protein ORM20_00179 [Ochrobactrum phage ORM_20]
MATEHRNNVLHYNWAKITTSKVSEKRKTYLCEVDARLLDGTDFRGFQVETTDIDNNSIFVSMLYSDCESAMSVYNAA